MEWDRYASARTYAYEHTFLIGEGGQTERVSCDRVITAPRQANALKIVRAAGQLEKSRKVPSIW